MPTEAVDVLIVGAGISGIGAAYYLQDRSPNQSFTIIEARSGLGGTWDLFRFPGVRSDSDLHTLGYEFRPWRDAKAIAGADKILSYLKDTAHEFELDKKIRFNQKLVSADWSSAHQRWTATVEHTDTGARDTISARWIFSASGYFRYDEGFTPIFAGQERFAGPVVHPQTWPADLDYSGKRVVVIGSGATAVTLVPAMSSAAHVTMLQRTPSYILPIASEDRIALLARRLLGADRAHPIIRRKNIAVQRALWLFARHFPTQARRVIRWANVRSLPAGFPVDTHFAPPYNPWDQRLCFVPDGDFFAAIRSGKASIETDRISTFTETGIDLETGAHLDADVIVTATGLNVRPFGGVALSIDGEQVPLAGKVAYKGMMLDGVPNFAYSIGYTNASWTLKVELLCEHFTRLLNYMEKKGLAVCFPQLPDGEFETRPLLDFGAGYVQRALDTLPRQGTKEPWTSSMSYHQDVRTLRRSPVADRFLRFL